MREIGGKHWGNVVSNRPADAQGERVKARPMLILAKHHRDEIGCASIKELSSSIPTMLSSMSPSLSSC